MHGGQPRHRASASALAVALLAAAGAAQDYPAVTTWQGCTCRDFTVESCAACRATEPARTAAPLRAPCSVLRAPGLTARVHGSQEHEVPGLRAAPAAIRQGRQGAQRLRLLR